MEFIAGIVVGILLSILAVLTGKKFETQINSKPQAMKGQQAIIIKKDNSVDDFLK